MKPNEIAATAAAFGAEGVDRGMMVQEWTVICGICRQVRHTGQCDIGGAGKVARTAGWRYTSKRGWECPAHRSAK